jgi:hypothetical protein
MKGTQPVGGQLWRQGDREMSATNGVLEGMDSGKESVAISAIAEALSWRYALENVSDPDYQLVGKRVIVYPAFLKKFDTVAVTGNVGLDLKGGGDVAYLKIMEECQAWRDDFKPTFI